MNFIVSFFQKIMDFIFSFWNNLPQSRKDQIIDMIVDSFTDLLKHYFQANRSGSGTTSEGGAAGTAP